MAAIGLIVKEVAKDAVEAALHKQGTYALQKMLESPCTDAEFALLGTSLMQKALDLVNGEPGIYVMGKLVEQLVRYHLFLHDKCQNPCGGAHFTCNICFARKADVCN